MGAEQDCAEVKTQTNDKMSCHEKTRQESEHDKCKNTPDECFEVKDEELLAVFKALESFIHRFLANDPSLKFALEKSPKYDMKAWPYS